MFARQKVLAQLKKSSPSTVREIARALKMSAPNVRHHLGVLVSDGRVEVVGTPVSSPLQGGQRGVKGRGRPEKVFSLSAALEGDNLSALAEALLAEAGSTVRMEALAKRLLQTDEFAGQPMARRLALLVEKLNEMHYQSRWEAGAEGPRVLFGRCPYAAVIEKHPELCRMDASLLGNALGNEVRQLSKIGKGQGVCVFAMK